MATRMTDDGQVQVPKHVQQQLGIGPGSEVDFRFALDGTVVIEKVTAQAPQPAGRLAELRGHAGPGMTTDELMALTRGE